jgi:sugar/nucleoside kinase (ribokinase family)
MRKSRLNLALILLILLPNKLAFSMDDTNKMYDVVAIGNSLVDIITEVNEQELKAAMPAKFNRSNTTNIDDATADKMIANMKNKAIIPGGSAANVMVNIATLGGKTAFNSIIANDEYGNIFKTSLTESGVDYLSPSPNSEKRTSRCLTFITPDKDRSFAVSPGIAHDFDRSFIDFDKIANAKILYIEGSAWDKHGPREEALNEAVDIANKTGTTVAFNLHNSYYIKQFRENFLAILPKTNIVISNEIEAKDMFQTKSLDTVIANYRKFVDIAIITQGKNGALLVTKDDIIKIPALAEPAKIVNTNGAGDAFTGGLLYGLTNGYNLKDSGYLGAKAAAEIIYQIGARPPQNLAEKIL